MLLYMPFLFFDQKNHPSITIPAAAHGELMMEINHDFPSYVRQLPCIYDPSDRKSYNGHEACVEYLARFQPPTPEPVTIPEPKLEVDDIEAPEPILVDAVEPKKKIARGRKPKSTGAVAETSI